MRVRRRVCNSGGVVDLGDQNANPDSEAMNSRDDPNRIAPKMRKISINRAEFEFRFASFAVTLLELELRPADRRQWRRTGGLPFFYVGPCLNERLVPGTGIEPVRPVKDPGF
jgi:hypothetical protein